MRELFLKKFNKREPRLKALNMAKYLSLKQSYILENSSFLNLLRLTDDYLFVVVDKLGH